MSAVAEPRLEVVEPVTDGAPAPSLLAFDLEVVGLRRLSPHFLRVTFGGPDLAALDDGGDLGPRDQRVKLLFAAPGHPLPDFGDLCAGWYAQWLAMDPATRGWMRTYTIRAARVRPEHGDPTIDVDFALHAEDGVPGPAASWAERARAGDRLAMLGPNAAARTAERSRGVEWAPPSHATRVLLAGDETAVPAIGSILATLPAGVRGHALVEVPTADDALDLPTASDVEVRWCARGGRPRGEGLAELVREAVGSAPAARAASGGLDEVDVDAEILWETPDVGPGDWYAWLAGEAAMVRDLRRYLVGERGLDRRQIAFMGYWREGRAESS